MLAVILMVVMVFILFIFASAGLDDLQIGSGVPASSGVASGAVVFTNEDAVAWHKMGRRIILSTPSDAQRSCVSALISSQMHEFLEMFRLTRNRRVCVRLLDSALDIFFPQVGTLLFESEMLELSKRLEMDSVKCLRRVQFIQDNNPSTGLRGCRISILYPEVTVIQVKALLGLFVYIWILQLSLFAALSTQSNSIQTCFVFLHCC